jgi:hypothetical protein
MNKRLIILFVMILIWALAACSLSQFGPRQEARITATPTRTSKPTFTATATPTRTLTPSSTPRPTATSTPTPIPTDTPPPTATPPPSLTPTETLTPLPTSTPTITPVPTRRPTARPTNTPVPKPTNTPPPPFTGKIVRGYTNCGARGITGQVKHANGSPYPGVAIGVWTDVWQGRVAVSEPSGKFELALGDVPPGTFKVAAVKLQSCTLRDGLPTAVDCQRISNVIDNVVTTEKCEGAGANQITEIEFVGP